MIRSPVHPRHPCNVGSIDSDGMRYGRAMKFCVMQ
ncbi:Uncharacterised protein [Mycobacteroides abscessus subsp. abscessus]|nr:Uncharacterised protein [Mycobacteroides abscessus subsp. abscessus]SKV04562.1 Uncharacterised protein [Mycobacteroides abscessus subsp. abscessus]